MDAVDEIKKRLNIEDVLSEYAELKRAGRNFKALSPFTNEKTPSLMVSPEKQIWHDFSSGKGGDMITFVQEVEGLDFKQTLELLARKAGVDLSQYQKSGGGNAKLKKRITEAHELATKFYQAHLSKNERAVEYIFKKRSINKQTALSFKLGYAPNNGSALTDFLLKNGFAKKELEQSGLVAHRRGQLSDMFRGRIMIPLMDQTGSPIGFTGRLLDDVPNAPKYLNTPQTILYDKSRHVFGLHLAKDKIRKQKFAVIVEGNMDVIASHQVGVTNVVATAGTAMTEMHLKAIGRFVEDIRLSFDQDEAGLSATERAIPLASKTGVSLSMISLNGAKDPDELIQSSPKQWQKAIDAPQYAMDWLIAEYQRRLDISTATGKRQFSNITMAVVGNMHDRVEQEHYIEKISRLLGVSKEALSSRLFNRQGSGERVRKRVQPVALDKTRAELIRAQNNLMALSLMFPDLRSYTKLLSEEMMPQEPARKLLAFLRSNPDFSGNADQAKELKDIGDYIKILALLFEELYQGLEILELRYEAARMQTRLIEQYVKAKKTTLADAMQDADEAKTQKLLNQAKELDRLLGLAKRELPTEAPES